MPKRPGLYCKIETLESRIAPAVFMVTSISDSGPGTLRDAITQANAAAGVDTIKFKLPTDSTLLLTTGPISITDSINITGPGAGKLTISGNNSSRIFEISDGTATVKTATISGLSFVDGNGAAGGAIFSEEAFVMTNCVVATSISSGSGGGLHVSTPGKISITGTKFIGNQASSNGGALYLRILGTGATGSIQITNCLISGNASGGRGGGLYARISVGNGNLTVDKTTISNNTAATGGGGAWLGDFAPGLDNNDGTPDDGKLTIKNSVITGNRLSGANSRGGGLYLVDGNHTIQNTQISDNTALLKGGGIFVSGDQDSFKMLAVKVSGNTTTDSTPDTTGGAGVYLNGGHVVTIQSSSFTGNRSASSGGAIQVRGGVSTGANGFSVKITGTTFSSNLSAGNGAAVDVDIINGGTTQDIPLTILSSKFFDNFSGNSGGGVSFHRASGALSVTGSVFSGNRAGNDGGAMDTTGGAATTIKSTMFTGNVSASEGGALYLRSTAATTIMASTFMRNSSFIRGGAISLGPLNGPSGAKLIMASKFIDNSTIADGGAIVVYDPLATLTLTGCTITGNVAGTRGGGVSNFGQATIIVNGGLIANNTAPTDPQIRK